MLQGESKSVKFGLNFRPQMRLMHSGFKTKQYIGNLYIHPPKIDIPFDSDISHPSRNFHTVQKNEICPKFGLSGALVNSRVSDVTLLCIARNHHHEVYFRQLINNSFVKQNHFHSSVLCTGSIPLYRQERCGTGDQRMHFDGKVGRQTGRRAGRRRHAGGTGSQGGDAHHPDGRRAERHAGSRRTEDSHRSRGDAFFHPPTRFCFSRRLSDSVCLFI